MSVFINPAEIHAPAGAYSHTVAVPSGAQMIFVSGQVGIRKDGSIPITFAEQTELVFQNLRSCLAAHGLGFDALVKITTFIVSGQDIRLMREIRLRNLGSHLPTSTAVFVPQLVDPDLLIEIEAVAIKPNA